MYSKHFFLLTCVTVLFNLTPVIAQSNPTIFDEQYFGQERIDGFSCIKMTADGGFIIGGGTKSFGALGLDAYLVRLNADRTLRWQNHYDGPTFGVSAGPDDSAADVVEDSEGNFVVAGGANSTGFTGQAWVFKVNANGQKMISSEEFIIEWAGVDASSWQIIRSVNGGYILHGYTDLGNRNSFLMKLRDNLTAEWETPLIYERGDFSTQGTSILELPNGNIVLSGQTTNEESNRFDGFMVRFTRFGNEVANSLRLYGDVNGGAFTLWSMTQTSDGGFCLVGNLLYEFGNPNPYLVRTDSDGNQLWAKETPILWPNPQVPLATTCRSVLEDQDSLVIVGGVDVPNISEGRYEPSALVFSTPDSPESTVNWQLWSDFNTDARDLVQDNYGNFVIVGTSESGFSTAIIDAYLFMVGNPPPPMPGTPGNFTAQLVQNMVNLSWSAPSSGADPVGYNIFCSHTGQTPIKINDEPIPGTSFSDPLSDAGQFCYSITAVDDLGRQGPLTEQRCVTYAPPTDDDFKRGNVNNDASIDLSDGIAIFGYLFLGTATPSCLDSADTNDDSEIDLSDGIGLLNFLFTGGNAPPEPFVAVGQDPTPDTFGCERYGA